MKRNLFCIITTFLIVFNLSAQKLTVQQAVEKAVENNFSIKQSKNSLELLEKKDNYSWNSVSPTFSIGGGFTDNLPVEGSENATSYSISGSVGVKLTPSVLASIKSAKIAYEAGEADYEATLRKVELNVRQSFYSLLNMTATIDSNKKSLEAAKRTYESNLAKYNKGQLDQLTLMTSQYNYESKIPVVESSVNTYENNLATFKQALGIPLSEEVTLDGTLDKLADITLDEEILSYDVDTIPEIKTILRNIETTKTSLLAARFSAYGPSVSVGYTYNGGASISPIETDYKTRSSTINLNVSIPLDGYLPWSTGALSIDTQKTNLENLQLQLENARVSAQISIRNSYNSIIFAQKQLKLCKSNLELMQKNYDMTLIAYNNGSKDLNTLQTAADNLSAARYSYQNQQYTIINNVLNLENTLGLPFGSLNSK